jgi:hypothetical protein
MTDACPILTGPEKELADILTQAEAVMIEKVMAALMDAEQAANAGFHESTLKATPPPFEYFASVLHQRMYCIMCGADPQTMEGGDPNIAIKVIGNSQNIARHYWGADMGPVDPAPTMKSAVSPSPPSEE